MGISSLHQAPDSSSSLSKMKAFVAAVSSLLAVASGRVLTYPGYYPGLTGLTYFAYAGYPGYATHGLTYAAPKLEDVPALAASAPLTYAPINPYDYAGLVYPIAPAYVHEDIPAEEYVRNEIEAVPYVHEEIEAVPYVHEEIAAVPYVESE